MKSIYVPVNFSDCAANAARYAADMALALHTSVHLVHIIQIPITSAEMAMTDYLYQEIVDSANISLNELQAELTKRTHGKVDIKTTLDAGSLSIKVKDMCQELKPYAIVVGTSGPTLAKLIAGSPVTSLLHNLTYPVLVVPEGLPFRRFRRILLACDLEDLDSGLPHSLPLLRDLREHFGSRFDVVTVETQKIPVTEHRGFDEDAWKRGLKDLYPEIHFIHSLNVRDGILDYLRQYDADLVMVFPKRHGLFDFHVSQSRKFAKHSPIPVMSLHE
jgi:nucleotide-binding universal stress UspA family protein